jgi:UrcA family protein
MRVILGDPETIIPLNSGQKLCIADARQEPIIQRGEYNTWRAECGYLGEKIRSKIMRKMLIKTMVGLLATGLTGGIALAQKAADTAASDSPIGDITVTASRPNSNLTTSVAGWPRSPVKQVTLSYSVNSGAFDLTTTAGEAQLEKLVNDTAMDVCKEIGRQYPGTTPDDAACAKAAAAKAMVKVHALVAAANSKKTAK